MGKEKKDFVVKWISYIFFLISLIAAVIGAAVTNYYLSPKIQIGKIFLAGLGGGLSAVLVYFILFYCLSLYYKFK